MEEIIHAFGIDQRLIVIQIVNFALLMAALGYFLYKPILRLLAERESKIAQGIKDAEAAARAKETAEADKQAVLAAAHLDAAAVAERAKAGADEKTAVLISTAEAKAAELLKNAEANALALRAAAVKESEKEVAQVAILAAEKLLRERA